MSTTFPRFKKSRRGYNVEQVEDFLEEARLAYSAEPGAPVALGAEAIRRTAFGMQKGGYSPEHVDAALERLEDAFASRERESVRREIGEEAWFMQARTTAKTIIDRLARPKRQRFRRVSFLSFGYDKKEVDSFADRLVAYFTKGSSMSVDDIRTIAFRPKKGGYQEAQVDVFLDTVIEVMLAVR